MRRVRLKQSLGDGEAYGDEVLARIFRYQRDKRIERQFALVESALNNIQKDLQSLREALAPVSL